MTDLAILSHFHKKQAWMASHIDAAQYPTPESKQGLTCYQASEQCPVLFSESTVIATAQNITIYNVDCHPLMVRYAKMLAQKWPESDSSMILEFLSQISLTDIALPKETTVALYVAMQRGIPAATGMVFSSEEDGGKIAGIYDLYGKSENVVHALKCHLTASIYDAAIIVLE